MKLEPKEESASDSQVKVDRFSSAKIVRHEFTNSKGLGPRKEGAYDDGNRRLFLSRILPIFLTMLPQVLFVFMLAFVLFQRYSTVLYVLQ